MAKRDKRPKEVLASEGERGIRNEREDYLDRQVRAKFEIRRKRVRDEVRSHKESGAGSLNWRYADASEIVDSEEDSDDGRMTEQDDRLSRADLPVRTRSKPKLPIVSRR